MKKMVLQELAAKIDLGNLAISGKDTFPTDEEEDQPVRRERSNSSPENTYLRDPISDTDSEKPSPVETDSEKPLIQIPREIKTIKVKGAKPRQRPILTALYDFHGEAEGDLPFVEGDIITLIKEYTDGWWLGKCQDIIGKFPSNLAHLIDSPEAFFIALEDFEGRKAGDLSFEKGELIQALCVEGPWIYGDIKGMARGWLPAKYVEIVNVEWDA